MKERDGKVVLDCSRLLIPVFSPVCTFCRYLAIGSDRQCAAFPDGIPMEIWLGKNRHTSPYPGDRGITFELAENVAPDVAKKYGFR